MMRESEIVIDRFSQVNFAIRRRIKRSLVALSRQSLKGGQFALKNTREDPGVVSQDRKLPRTGGRLTSFDCIFRLIILM